MAHLNFYLQLHLCLHSLILVLSITLSPTFPHSLHAIPSHAPPTLTPLGTPDEVYAQKMKYKAISEELDNALNDITSL